MEKLVVSDSSSLILLQKIALLEWLTKIYEIIIPKKVYEESVIIGKKRKHPDAFFIDEYVKSGKINVLVVSNNKSVKELIDNYNIHQGEAEAIVLYGEIKAKLIIIDDHKAINVCKSNNVLFITALTFVIRLFKANKLSKEIVREKIYDLSIYGRYRDEIIIHALRMLEV